MSTIKQLAVRFRWALIALLSIPAGLSLSAGVRGAISSSQDFQWAGSSLLRTGIDPWRLALLGHSIEVPHFIAPGYLHIFYVTLLPLSMLSFRHAAELWCCLNIVLSIGIVYLLKNLFGLSRFASIAALLILWISTPYRTVIQTGQTSIFELVLLCIVFCTTNSTLRGLALGFSLSNYSFAPIVLTFLWFKHNIRTLTIAAIVAFLGLVLTWSMLGGSILQLAFEPFAVSSLTVSPGLADLITPISTGLAHWLPAFKSARTIAFGLGLLASASYGFFLSRRRLSNAAYLTLLSLASLFTLKHLMCDFVFLLVPLCFALSERGKSVRPIALPVLGVFWFMDGLFRLSPAPTAPATAQWLASTASSCILGTLLVYLTWSLLHTERVLYAARSRNDRRSASTSEVTLAT